MAHPPCGRLGYGTGTASVVHQQQEKLVIEAALTPHREQQQQLEKTQQLKTSEQPTPDKHLSQKERHLLENRSPSPAPPPLPSLKQHPLKNTHGTHTGATIASTKRPPTVSAAAAAAATTASTTAAAPISVTTSSKHSLRSPTFADLPVSSSSSSTSSSSLSSSSKVATATSHRGKHNSGQDSTRISEGCRPSEATASSSVTSKARAPPHDRMEALGGGSGYPYSSSHMIPGNASAYKPGSNVPAQLHLRGAWPPPHIEGFASLPVGASSLYPPYLSLSGLSPSAAPLGGVAFLPPPPPSSIHSPDGQPVPATIHPVQTDMKAMAHYPLLTGLKETESSFLPLTDGSKHLGLSKRHPATALLPPKVESDVSGAMRAGKHDKLVWREGHGNDSQSRQTLVEQPAGGRRRVKEEEGQLPYVDGGSGSVKHQPASSFGGLDTCDGGGGGSSGRTLKRAGNAGERDAKGNSPPLPAKEKRDSATEGPERKKKSSKKRHDHTATAAAAADENGNSLKIPNDGKPPAPAPLGKALSERLSSPTTISKAPPGNSVGPACSVGTVLSVGIDSYPVPGDLPHTTPLLKTVSPPPLTTHSGHTEGCRLVQKASPGGGARGPGYGDPSHTAQKRLLSPKDPARWSSSDSGSFKSGKEEKQEEKIASGNKSASPKSGATPASISPLPDATSSITESFPTPPQTHTTSVSPSNSNTPVHLGYMPMYLPNTCQLSLEKESNKDAPRSGTKVHATTFVPAPGEFIPGPATNATTGVSAGRDSKCKTSPSLPVGAGGKSSSSQAGKGKTGDGATSGRKDSPKILAAQRSPPAQTDGSGGGGGGGSGGGGTRSEEKKSWSKSPSGDVTDSGKSHTSGHEPKDDLHSRSEESERREAHWKKRHVSGNPSGMKHDSRGESKPDRTTGHSSSGKHNSRARSVSGPDPSSGGLLSPRDHGSKHSSDRHLHDKSAEDHHRMELVAGRVVHPSLYYDMAMVERSRTDPALSIPAYHPDCFTPSSAAHEALARQESMLRTALMGSSHRASLAASGPPLVSSPSAQPFLVSSHSTSMSNTQASKKQMGSSGGDGVGIPGRGTPGMKVSDGRCPPIGIAVAQQRQDGDSGSGQGRGPPRSSSRSATSSPHISRVLPSSVSSSLGDKRETEEDRAGRGRDPSGLTHGGRLGDREPRSHRDQSPRESRLTSDVPFHPGAHRRYPHDLSANLVVTGGGTTLGRPDTTIHPHLPATPHHWLPRPPSHPSPATPSHLWPYGIPSSSSPMASGGLDVVSQQQRASPFPMGPGGMHWAQDPTTGQLMLVPPHPTHPDNPLSNLAMWPRYIVPPHLQPHSHQLQQLMLNQFPYAPLPGPAHPSQHPGLLPHIPGAGSSSEVQALLQQQHEVLANMYRHAEQQERSRKEHAKVTTSEGGSTLKSSVDMLKGGGSGHHRNRRESGDVKCEARPESRQSDRSRTGSQEALDIKHSIHHAQPPFLQAIPVAASQHPSLPFIFQPPVPYLYENPPSSNGPPTPGARLGQDVKDKKDFLPDRTTAALQTHISPHRTTKEKKEGVLKSTSVQTSPAETPPAPVSKVEADEEDGIDASINSQSAKVSRTQQTETSQQKVVQEPNIDVVTVDSPDTLRTTASPHELLQKSAAQAKLVDSEELTTPEPSHQETNIQTDTNKNDTLRTDVISIKQEVHYDKIVVVDKDERLAQISTEAPSEAKTQIEAAQSDHLPSDCTLVNASALVDSQLDAVSAQEKPAATTAVCSATTAANSTSIPTTRESLISNVMTTMQSFAATVDGLEQLDHNQLAAIEGIALLSEVAERKALATRAEFWNCVAEQHRTENSDEQDDDAQSTTTESNIPLQGNSVSAMTSNGSCELDNDDLAGISPGELSLKIRCPITIKKEANGRSEVSACGAPLGSADNMNPMELEMRMKLAELQRKYKEKKKELDKLQKKKDKKAKEDSKTDSPTVEKRRGRGRPRKRKFSSKTSSETAEAEVEVEAEAEVEPEAEPEPEAEAKAEAQPEPEQREVRTLHSSATVLLEAAASLEEPAPKKKKKKDGKIKKEQRDKEKMTKQGKKVKKSKSKVEGGSAALPATPSDTKPHTKKKKDKTKTSSKLSPLTSEGDKQMTALKVKGSKCGKKRVGSPIRSDVESKKHLSSKTSKKLHLSSITNQDSLTSDTDSGSIIWPLKATPSSPSSSATSKTPKSPKTKTKLSKKLKTKESKLGLSGSRKKKSKVKDAATLGTSTSSTGGAINKFGLLPTSMDFGVAESKPKPGLSIAHVYGEDSDSTLEDSSTVTTATSSGAGSSWSSHKGLALLAELSSNQSSSSRCGTPTKVKRKKPKDKTKSGLSSSTGMLGTSRSGTSSVKRDGATEKLTAKARPKTSLSSSSNGSSGGLPPVKRDVAASGGGGGGGTGKIRLKSSLTSSGGSSGMSSAKRDGAAGNGGVTRKVGLKKGKLIKKKLATNVGDKVTVMKKMKKVSKPDKESKSPRASSKSEKPKKAKPTTSSHSEKHSQQQSPRSSTSTATTKAGTSSNSTFVATPQFDERSWCRRRSERIFLSDISPVQSRDISPQRKLEGLEQAKKKLVPSPGENKKSATEGSGAAVSHAAGGGGGSGQSTVVSQIGSVLDALKTDPLQMRKKLIRLSAPEEEGDDDGHPKDEVRRKKLKKKARRKDKIPDQERVNPLELALNAREFLSDSSDSDGENVPLSSLVERPSTPAPRNCVLSVEELKDGQRVLIPIDGLFHAGNVQAIQPPDVYGVVIEGGRGSRPHVFSQEQILQEAIADVRPSSTRYLPEGTRICAYWSQQYKYLYPGTVVKGSPNPTLDSNFTTVEFDDGDSGRIPLDHIRMLPQDFPLVNFEPSPITVQRKRRRRPSETSSTTEWKMDLMKDDEIDDRPNDKRREYSWRSQNSKDDFHPISEGDNDVFLPSPTKLKKNSCHQKTSKKLISKKTKGKLKLKTKAKGSLANKTSSSQSDAQTLQDRKARKLTKLKKRKAATSVIKFGKKLMQQKKQGKVFAVKSKKGKTALPSADRKTLTTTTSSSGKKKSPTKKLGGSSGSGRAKCTVEIETVYSSEVFPDELDYPEGLGGTLADFNSDNSSDDESDHYSKSADAVPKKKKTKKKKKNSPSSSCNLPAFSPPRQFWRWLGKATQRRGSKGKARKLFYKSIIRDKEIIRVGECAVFLSTGRPHLPYIGRIESMWESWGGMMVVRVKWFYHPEETKGGRKPNDGKMALYLSQHVDENDVQTISHKCEVLSLDDFKQYVSGKKALNTIVRAPDIYYLAGTYDPGSGHTVSAN